VYIETNTEFIPNGCAVNALDMLNCWYPEGREYLSDWVIETGTGIHRQYLHVIEECADVVVFSELNKLNITTHKNLLQITIDGYSFVYPVNALFSVVYVSETYGHMTTLHGYNLEEMGLITEGHKIIYMLFPRKVYARYNK
jgi:hypothetical protein